MKKFLGVLVVLCATVLAACGDKASDAEGTWVLDANASFEASRPALKAQMPEGVPPEAAKQFEEGMKSSFQSMTVTVTLKGDKTFTSKFAGEGRTEDTSGTWSAAGDKVTLQAKTKDGKPAEGDDATPLTLTLKDGSLTRNPNAKSPVTIVLKRG